LIQDARRPGCGSPWDIPADWPVPDAEARRLSESLVRSLREQIHQAGGSIPFAHYMEQVLYAPGAGYYSAGLRKFGRGGDFVTAPELSPLFARCLARTCEAVLGESKGGELLELGAGSGSLAGGLLAELDHLGCLPDHYLILERSGELRERQRQTLAQQVPQLLTRVHWLDRLPAAPVRGLMIANEVIDALPVHRFARRAGLLQECRVAWDGNRFQWHEAPVADPELLAGIEALALGPGLRQPYFSEINLGLKPWLSAIAEPLAGGAMLFFDYGYPRRDYYHPQRSNGTLMCHYRHRAHGDPFLLPGLQDITASVDFTALAEAASASGLAVSGFATQAHFLLDAGIEPLLAEREPDSGVGYLETVRQAKLLMLPGEMGERFKAMLLTRGQLGLPPGFRAQDLRGRL
jgi:SAM-dependent MidA family methyltransferase